jgi:hypothetical protein
LSFSVLQSLAPSTVQIVAHKRDPLHPDGEMP